MPKNYLCELCGKDHPDSNIHQVTIEIFLCTDCLDSLESHGDAHRDENEGILLHESALIQLLNRNLDRITVLVKRGDHIRKELKSLWDTPKR